MDKWESILSKVRESSDTGVCRGMSEPGGCKCRMAILTQEEKELLAFSTQWKGWQG